MPKPQRSLQIRICRRSVPVKQTEEADDQGHSNCEDIGQLHVIGWPATPMPDRRIGVKAIVHHCFCKRSLKRKIKRSGSGGALEKKMSCVVSTVTISACRKLGPVSGDIHSDPLISEGELLQDPCRYQALQMPTSFMENDR